jgi:hypothetical protein
MLGQLPTRNIHWAGRIIHLDTIQIIVDGKQLRNKRTTGAIGTIIVQAHHTFLFLLRKIDMN